MFRSMAGFILSVLVLSQTGCNFFKKQDGDDEYAGLTYIPRDHEDERNKAFNKYPVEKQINIYLIAV